MAEKFARDKWVIVHSGEMAGAIGLIVSTNPAVAQGICWQVEFTDGSDLFIYESDMAVTSNRHVLRTWQEYEHSQSSSQSDE